MALEDQKEFFQRELRDREKHIEKLIGVRTELSSYIQHLADAKKAHMETIRELEFTQSRLENKSEELEKATTQLQIYKELLNDAQSNDFAPLEEQRKTPCLSMTLSYRTRMKVRKFNEKLDRVKEMDGVGPISEEDEPDDR